MDQQRQRLLQFIAENASTLAGQGSVRTTWRRRGGKSYGPFYLLVFREHGRQRSRYLGSDAGLADAVRSRLAELQAPLRQLRIQEKILAGLLEQFREGKRRFDEELRAVGLYRRGNEIRGWRRASNKPRPARGRKN